MLFQEYYYNRYRQLRKNVRSLLVENDIQTARTILNSIVVENDRYYQTTISRNDVTAKIDNSSLHHAQDHLEAFTIDSNQTIQKDATMKALEET